MSILSLEKVSYMYEGTTKKVINDVNINFELGKMYVIMGKSGAGKSTLLSLISGLDVCTEGKVIYKGQDMKDIDRDKYRSQSIGVIFQGFNLLTNATARENIELSMNISKSEKNFFFASVFNVVKLSMNISKSENRKDKHKITELLDKVGIDEETSKRKILKLSGGEQQRVGIARALSHTPDIIIADEPTGNLDSATEKNIMSIFKSLARDDNKCVIIVTHSKQVEEFADENWGLNKGNLLFVK